MNFVEFPKFLQRQRTKLFIYPFTKEEAAKRAEKINQEEKREIAYLVDEISISNRQKRSTTGDKRCSKG